ncbi:MAG: site-2 protease family protein [Acidobacteria bacterium]|nr:site-2 protease family protein [Acidobacteriota bacterium]
MSGIVALALMLAFWWMLVTASRSRPAAPPPRRQLPASERPAGLDEVLDDPAGSEQDGVLIFSGRLRVAARVAYERLQELAPLGTVPLLQEGEEGAVSVILAPAERIHGPAPAPTRPALHWLLFGLTLLTTTWAGSLHHGATTLDLAEVLRTGLPYSAGLMAILGIHELGHFFAARAHRMDVTPPYFIPVPFALGTFGAFIRIRSRPKDRKALFDMAVAGPLAGLAVAVPALLVGLQSSEIVAAPAGGTADPFSAGTSVGSSILFAALAKLSLGPALEAGHILRLSPLAFAGWLGLLVTALNLLPIGQLDGGHVTRALLGHRAGSSLGTVAMWSLLLLAFFVWPGLLFWAVLVFFLAGRGAPPLEDVTPLEPGRRLVGFATLGLLILLLLPLPHSLWAGFGIHCPYL